MEELLCSIHKKPQEPEYKVCRLLRPVHTLPLLVFLWFKKVKTIINNVIYK